jgi:hypothetical protein
VVFGDRPDNFANGERDPLTVTIIKRLSHGTVSFDTTTGKFEYTPDPGFVGQDTFSISVSDGQQGAEPVVAVITIKVTGEPIQIPVTVAPIQQPELKFTGCPAVMNWAAKELDVEADQLQIYMVGSLSLSSNVQPCEACANLQSAALTLKDADGSRIKALGQVVSEFAAGSPSEEQFAMIAVALQNPEEGTPYALAKQWLNGMTEYVSILHNDLNLSIDDSVRYVAKYTSRIINGDNAALSAFIQAKLADLSE